MGARLLEAQHGYRPLMAETFTDIEQFEGTCYKASNWKRLGLTKGFERHRGDYFKKHGRPKKLWIKSLNRNAPAHPERHRCAEDL